MAARKLLLIFPLIFAGPSLAASQADVQAYADYAAAFDARQGRPEIASDTRRALADCIVSAFEAQHGGAGVARLIDLMRTIAAGVQFDDPTVVQFTEAYGDNYGAIVSRCRSSILNG